MTPASIHAFRFTRYRFDATEGRVYLEYALDEHYVFCETLYFPGARLPLDDTRRAALERVLYHLHLVAGVSYYKAAVPPRIEVETQLPDAATAKFLDTLYLHGLGEFAYRNGLDLRGHIHFPSKNALEGVFSENLSLPKRIVLPLGGGKDSLVALHALQHGGREVTLFSVGNPSAIAAVAAKTDLPHIVVQRKIDPLLFELNRQGAYNGHVPITAIIAFILAAAAVLYGFDTVVMANERSADSANLTLPSKSTPSPCVFFPDGEKTQGEGVDFEVNHQYSKSLAFEVAVQRQFARILPGFRYFSLLRGLSELEITRLFARHGEFHEVFSSCNANYKIDTPSGHQGRWCLQCPKCRFVFLSLAPFLPKARMLEIFGANLLADPAQQDGFDALLGHAAHKPFECVGEVEESQAAFYLLSEQAEWREELSVRRFREVLLPRIANPRALVERALAPLDAPTVAREFAEMLDAYRRA